MSEEIARSRLIRGTWTYGTLCPAMHSLCRRDVETDVNRIHDRMLFLDQRGWVIGQSIKAAAKKKPTYLIELNEPSLTASRDAHDKIWKQAKIII